MSSVLSQLGGRASRVAGGARTDRLLEGIVVVFTVLLAMFSLREYMDAGGGYLAAPDYLAEILPAVNALRDQGIQGYLDNLPGYHGAALIEIVPAQISLWLGASETTTWRLISAFGISILGLAILSTVPLARAGETTRGAARTALILAAASPAAYWALRIGHPEELMSTGLLLGAVVAAAKERPVIAGLLLGLAVGKAWPAVAALPVLGLLLPDPVRVAKGMAAAAFAAAVIFLPSFLFAASPIDAVSGLGQSGIFNVGQVFWWFGDPLPSSVVMDYAQQRVPQPRGFGPVWSGELSHPLILGVGTAIGLIWSWTLYGRLTSAGHRSLAALRADGRTRSRQETTQLAAAALLVMAGILYARCFLDTWNVPYYLLPALVLGALGEMLAGRRPILTLLATGLMWKWHAPGDLTVRSDPDIYTALYLAWTIPFCLAFLSMGFRAARGVILADAPSASDVGLAPEHDPAGPASGADGGSAASVGSSVGEPSAVSASGEPGAAEEPGTGPDLGKGPGAGA